MAEAEQMSDRVAILLNGRLARIGTPLEITATGAGMTKISVQTQADCLAGVEIPGVSQHLWKDGYHIYYSQEIGTAVSSIINQVQTRGDTLIDLRVERPSLEDRFLEITNQGARQ
jgi:ABC-2 type transport system ATP-binding protein